MSLSDNDRLNLLSAWNHPGGLVLRRLLDEQMQEPKDELYEIMARKPDTLTGKSAVRLAARARALADFRDEVEGEIRKVNG